MNTKELKEFIEKYSFDTKIIECLELYLEEYKKEHLEEFNEVFPNYSFSKIDTWLSNVSFKAYNWPELDYVNIVIDLIVSYEDSEIGVYQLFCNINGDIEDDILRIS